MAIWLQREYTRGLGYEKRPRSFPGLCGGYQKLLGALVVEQAHVSVFTAELAMDLYISYVHLVAAWVYAWVGLRKSTHNFFRIVWRPSKLLCALVVEQAHVSLFEAELDMDMYISYVHLFAA